MKKKNKHKFDIRDMTLFALLLAIGWMLPFITGNIPTIGNMLLPMHLPVLICGFVMGPFYGLILGLVLPLTRSLFFGSPILYPSAIGMMVELATYGFVSGFLYSILIKKTKLPKLASIFIALISAMLLGRCLWGVTRLLLAYTPNGGKMSWSIFISSGFVIGWPGMLIQLVAIPALVILCEKEIEKYNFKKNR